MTKSLSPIILYHANCYDGFGAAYAAWVYLGDNAEYRPIQYGDSVPLEPLIGRQVFILDFSFSPDTILAMSQIATQVTLLDHHKSAAEQWQGVVPPLNAEITFDMNRSGAQMSWDHFHPSVSRPILIDHIGDRDLWRFDLPDTKAFCAGLSIQPTTFEVWQRVTPEAIIASGRVILDYQRCQVDGAMNRDLRSVTLAGHQGLAANVINNTSEVGHEIARRSGTFSLTFFIKGDDVICSLRSVAPFDVSEIAKHYGGGGHAQASGFTMPINQFFSEIWR
ncbi:DHHA1 domain-containing protein [Propionivibrio sp.]|uniref:DHHA1 domain-containing protein n=1 Tax=Propionivibrio sp. TaxID=2212460 RepID=UPI003BF401EE